MNVERLSYKWLDLSLSCKQLCLCQLELGGKTAFERLESVPACDLLENNFLRAFDPLCALIIWRIMRCDDNYFHDPLPHVLIILQNR